MWGMYDCVCVCACECRCPWRTVQDVRFPKIELWIVVNHWAWTLESKLRPSTRTLCAPNC